MGITGYSGLKKLYLKNWWNKLQFTLIFDFLTVNKQQNVWILSILKLWFFEPKISCYPQFWYYWCVLKTFLLPLTNFTNFYHFLPISILLLPTFILILVTVILLVSTSTKFYQPLRTFTNILPTFSTSYQLLLTFYQQ